MPLTMGLQTLVCSLRTVYGSIIIVFLKLDTTVTFFADRFDAATIQTGFHT